MADPPPPPRRRTWNRPDTTQEDLESAVRATLEKLNARLKEKGISSFASKHEILGILVEEMRELEDAVRAHGNPNGFKEELLDIAVGAIYGIACFDAGTLDW